MQYLGCSLDFLKKWFDFNFSSEMNWSNRGVYWHIDHITPCDSFDLEQQSEIYKCYNWTNLRPLEKTENIRKSNKIYSDIIVIMIYVYKMIKLQYYHNINYNDIEYYGDYNKIPLNLNFNLLNFIN